MPEQLTRRQADVLAMIRRHLIEHQRPPSRQEIADHFGWASVNSAEEKVQALRKKGYIELPIIGGHGFRNIKIKEQPMPLNTGVAQPCRGVLDAYSNTFQPLPMCQSCYLFRMRRTDPPMPTISPRVVFDKIAQILLCSDRVQALP